MDPQTNRCGPDTSHDLPVKIVLADRDQGLQTLARSFLESAGHRIFSARDGQAALVAVREQKPRILVTEILLPKLDGLALCRMVKSDPQLVRTRVLVFSVLAAGIRAKEVGADAFLAKPLVKERLIGALSALLRGIDSTPTREPDVRPESRPFQHIRPK